MRLELKKVTRTYGNTPIVSNIAAHIEDTEIIGLIGRNGAGKSTLCNIISGNDTEYDGDVFVYPNTHIAYFKQIDTPFEDTTVTVFEYVLSTQKVILELDKKYHDLLLQLKETPEDKKVLDQFGEVQDQYFSLEAYSLLERIEDTLSGLGIKEHGDGERNISWHSQMSTLSGGERKIVELTTILLDKKANFLILDEPTNHLDIKGRNWLEQFIKGFSGSIILVSHDRHLLDEVCNKMWHISSGELTTYSGNYSRFKELKAHNDEALMHKYALQQKEYARLNALVAELFRKVKIGGGPAIVGQYNATKSRIEQFEKTLIDNPMGKQIEFDFNLSKPKEFGYNAIRINNLNFIYSNDRKIFTDASADILNGDKIALLGDNGSGKSTLLKIILTQYCKERYLNPKDFGIEEFYEYNAPKLGKEIVIGPSVTIAYYSQNHAQLNVKLTIREFLATLGIRDESKFQSLVRRFQFEKDTVDFKRIGDLSGGEKSKLQFLLVMMAQANVLLLDEPINHLDIPSMEVIESLLLEFKGTIMVISHDQYFLNRVINKVLKLGDEGISPFQGTYHEYLEKYTKA